MSSSPPPPDAAKPTKAFEVQAGPRHYLVARSKPMAQLLDSVRRIASVPRPVLIRGERGVGKEIVAAVLHYEGARARKSFLTVNCAALNASLLSSELFGHERGAFTGASERRAGKFEQADGGTLFLDEIGNMPMDFQEKILRVLEYQEFERVGGSQPVRVDVRVIAATNADVETMMDEGVFRRDLYDRLAFHTVCVPPLRHRREDIPLLISYFKSRFLTEVPNFEDKVFTPEAMREMIAYYWPGNVRQLKAVVESLMCMDTGHEIDPEELPREVTATGPGTQTFQERVEQYKRTLILNALRECQGNQRRAAESLGMSYDQLRHFYRKFDLGHMLRD
ncbi:sigma 54-interacting transcriptional regulator [Candidatus Sumerlaeota bacterium]|nr:sigma 54-interacting transcriptional regulator [Candidatus Sumerlaeota bacterium]